MTDTFLARYGDRLANATTRPPLVLQADARRSDEDLAGVEVAWFSPDTFPDRVPEYLDAIERSPALRWFATLSAGVDHPFFHGLLARGVRLTTSSGSSAVPIAEGVLAGMLALARGLPAAVEAQRAHRWERAQMDELAGARVLVVGLGPIGAGVVERCRAFAMEVEAMRRRPDGTEAVPTHAYADLAAIVGRFDWIVLAAPLSPLTAGLVSAAVIAAMRPGARLVNIGRGGLVDEQALVAGLRAGRVGGAYLDVTAVEPLPADSELWDLPTVLITAHTSGASTGTVDRANDIFLDNLRRYDAGAPLLNEVTAEST